jgi:methyl-accepting chemotaxis protein
MLEDLFPGNSQVKNLDQMQQLPGGANQEEQMRLTLGKKLGLGFGVILTLMLISGTVSILKIQKISQLQDFLLDTRVPSLDAGRALQRDLFQTGSKCRQTILAGNQADRRQDGLARFQKTWDSIDKDLATLSELSPRWTLPENRDRLANIKAASEKARGFQQNSMDIAAGRTADAMEKAGNDYADKATPAVDGVVKIVGDMVGAFEEMNKKSKEDLDSANRTLIWMLSLSTLISLGVGVFVAIFLSRGVSATTQSILAQMQAIAGGNLTRAELKIQGNDELADLTRAINEMQSSLSKVIQSMRGTAEQVAAASEELSATSQQITANSEETTAQAKVVSDASGQVNTNLQTLASGAEEMNSTIGEIAKNATEAARVAGEAVEAAESANQTVSKLGDSSVEIEKVIEVITSIAQQTNLLALNATIEAARAGEAGKGFAVVANEVKELAKQTAKATEEIKQKISVIRENTGGAVTAIGGIKGVIDKVSHISTVIATAVEEQSATTSEMTRNVSEAARGASTISDTIKGVAEAAQSTSTSVGESQTSTEHLSRMANQLRDLVSQFKVGESARQSDQDPVMKAARHAAGAR